MEYYAEQVAKGDPCYVILQTNEHSFGTDQIMGLVTPPILALTPFETGGIFTITAYDENGEAITKINDSSTGLDNKLIVELTLVTYEKE